MSSIEQQILASALGAGIFAGIIALWKLVLFPNAEHLIAKHRDKDQGDSEGKDHDTSNKN